MQPRLFENQFAERWPPARCGDERLLLAVSGGLDSTALVRLVTAVRGGERLCLAHFHHGLRDAADADAQFVAGLADDCGGVFRLGTWDRPPPGLVGLESAAREARYQFLLQTAHEFGARRIAAAHTADDQAETVLHHLLRGSSLRGAAGMPRTRRLSGATTLCRPLLSVRRRRLRSYLEAIGQPYCVDESNESPAFTRNRLRAALPLLAQTLGRDPTEALLRLAKQSRQTHRFLVRQADAWLEDVLIRSGEDAAELAPRQANGADRVVIREAFVLLWRRLGWPRRDLRAGDWNDLATAAMSAAPTSRSLPGGVQLRRDAERLRLHRIGGKPPESHAND